MYATCTRIRFLFKQRTIGMLALARGHGSFCTRSSQPLAAGRRNAGTDPLNALLHNDNTKALIPTVPRAHRVEKRADRYGGEAAAHWSPPRVEDLHKGKDAGRAARPMGRSQKEAVLLSAA